MVIVTAILGVNLLKQQGVNSWSSIQTSLAHGQIPALELLQAVQLLFAGGLLLTPGFVTDIIGFSLMVPAVRAFIALKLMQTFKFKVQRMSFNHSNFQQAPNNNSADNSSPHNTSSAKTQQTNANGSRTIEGEYEKKN